MTALPEPSGFRTLTLHKSAPAELFAARLVYERIDFNYSEFNGEHRFVYPVQYFRRVYELKWEMLNEDRQPRKTSAETADTTAQMVRTLRRAFCDSGI